MVLVGYSDWFNMSTWALKGGRGRQRVKEKCRGKRGRRDSKCERGPPTFTSFGGEVSHEPGIADGF